MKLEDQVCSLELSKRLKELGVRQESIFYWCDGNVVFIDKVDWERVEFNSELTTYSLKDVFSAFTVAELGLPFSIKQYPPHGEEISLFLYQYPPFSDRSFYEVAYLSGFGSILDHYEIADTEANARAKMRIYLIENKLVEI